MVVEDIMSQPVITATADTPAPEIARLMREHDIGAVPVVDESGRLCGLVTESDFTGIARAVPFSVSLAPVVFGARPATLSELERLREMARKLTARDLMTEKVITADPSEEVGVIVHRMLKARLKHMPVVRDGRPVGMVARHDLLKILATEPEGPEGGAKPR